MTQERIAEAAAGAATAGSWTLWGISLTHVNEALQTVAFLAAIACSCAAFFYYRKKTPK